MGLTISILRSDYDSTDNAFHGYRQVTIVNADGPFDPAPLAPAAKIVRGPLGDPIIVPLDDQVAGLIGPMFGGTYGATSDGRFRDAMHVATGIVFYGALPIHDRYETPAQYRALTAGD